MISFLMFMLCLMFLPLVLAFTAYMIPMILIFGGLAGLVYFSVVTFGGGAVVLFFIFGPLLLVLVEMLREKWEARKTKQKH